MLRRMDEGSASDVIKAVTIFKLGNMVENMGPDQARFEKFSSLLADPSQAKTIVWDDLVDIKDSFPPIEKILGAAKYEVVDRDILSNFGVSQILVTGADGGFAGGFLSVRTLQEKLETLRNDVLNGFVIPEIDRLRRGVKFGEKPSLRFCSMSLRDEDSHKKLVKELLDRKVISVGSTLEAFDFDPEIEASRMNKEKSDKRFKQLSPFDPKPASSGPGGRPGNTGKPLETKRKTKPTGVNLTTSEVKNWKSCVVQGWILIHRVFNMTARLKNFDKRLKNESVHKPQ